MLLKLILITIILYIVINHFMESDGLQRSDQKRDFVPAGPIPEVIKKSITKMENMADVVPANMKSNTMTIPKAEILENIPLYNKPEHKVWEFDEPNPWSKIVYNNQDEYPYYFHIKLVIPSLKDYQDWKEVIPNIDFNPRSREIIIPSKDEASALAVANLMAINFSGQMSLENILDKNLLQISISKAKTHEVVQSKLRDQIMETIHGKSQYSTKPQFADDLSNPKNKLENRQLSGMGNKMNETGTNQRINFQSEDFKDTFEHFATNTTSSSIEAFDGNDFYSF
jgi:hypothetical protein